METGAGPLVGRRRELERVAAALADPDCRGVGLRGGAGAGKTRLAVECLQIAAGLGFVTRRVSATASTRAVPLGAMASLIPPLGPDVNPLGAALAALRDAATGSGRLLVLVDDAQWLDDTSGALIHQAVTDGTAFAILTVRDGERPPAAIASLLRDESIVQVELPLLEDQAVARMVTGLLPGDVDPQLVQRVVELGHGSPLHVRELVVGGVECGAVAAGPDRTWRIVGRLEGSARVADLVAERLERLDEEPRRALSLLAVTEPLPSAWIPPTALDTFAALESAGLVAVRETDSGEELQVSHPLYGEVLRNELSPLRRRALLAELVDSALAEAEANDDAQHLRLMMWSIELGLPVATDNLRRASRRAFSANRFDLAAAFLDAVPEGERDSAHRYDLMSARFYCDELDEAFALLDAMEADPRDDHELARALEERIIFAQVGGDLERAHRLARDALDRLTDPDARLRIEMVELSNSILEMSPAEAAEALMPLADAEGDLGVVVNSALAGALSIAGRAVRACEVAAHGHEVHRRLWLEHTADLLPAQPTTSLLFECLALSVRGRPADADALLTEAHLLAAGSRGRQATADVAVATGAVALRHGRLADCLRTGLEAMALYDGTVHRHGPRWLMAAALATLAAAQIGDREQTSALAERLDQGHELRPLVYFVGGARSWADLVLHGRPAAIERFRALCAAALEEGDLYPALDAAWALVRLDAADRVPEAVLDLGGHVEGELLQGWLAGVRAARSRHPEQLDALAEELATLEAHLDAAEAAAAASRLWSAAGNPRRATASARRARDQAARCQGVRTPGLVLPEEPVPLTPREREVAALAADGLPAREIAERLFISWRTVTNHLQHVYDKLGVSSRSELRAALGGQ